jgi:hypothetical protein
MSDTTNPAEVPQSINLSVSFGRSPHYRSIHSNGAWFSTDPEGNFRFVFYNEYFPTPKKMTLLLNSQGQITGENEAERESISGIIRELEVDVIMSYSVAVDFHKILGENLEAVAKARRAAQQAK